MVFEKTLAQGRVHPGDKRLIRSTRILDLGVPRAGRLGRCMTEFRIESWSEDDPRWAELVELFDTQEQLRWVLPDEKRLRPSSEVLVAVADERPVGFLVFLVQEIGPPDNCPAFGQTEAKVVAFAVRAEYRRRGIGTALQRRALEVARQLDCYQLRSVTDVWRDENRQVKLALGFGVHPTVRRVEDEERPAYVFVKRL
jgi:GNAT superfamily N-acetyltransferase